MLEDLLSLSMRPVVDQTNEIPHKNHNRDLANGWYVDRCLFLDIVGEVLPMSETVDNIRDTVCTDAYLFAGEIYTHSTITDLLCRDFEAVSRHTTNDHLTDGQAVLQGPALLVGDFVLLLLQAGSSAELLYASDVDAVDLRTIIRKQSGQGSPNDFAAVDNRDPPAKQPLAGSEECVVDLQMLEDLDDGQRSAWQNGFHGIVRIQKTDVLVHVTDELRSQAFDVLEHADGPLQSAVSLGVENGIVDDHTVDVAILVGLA